jgi:prophage regulatory protein
MRDDDTLMTMPEVGALTRLSKPTIYQMIREDRFPRQVRLGPNKVAWLRSEVRGWICTRAEAREAV